jgi:hypothetical protein
MRFILMLSAVSGTLMMVSPAAFAASGHPAQSQVRSQIPAWCLGGGGQGDTGDCVYRSLEQCVQDRIGQGGECYMNPYGPGDPDVDE